MLMTISVMNTSVPLGDFDACACDDFGVNTFSKLLILAEMERNMQCCLCKSAYSEVGEYQECFF